MDILLIIAAFVSGFIALKCNLPPLVGFLIAGFGLQYAGFASNETITTLSDLRCHSSTIHYRAKARCENLTR